MKASPLDDIVTARLVLRLMHGEIIRDCLEGDLERASEKLGVRIPEEFLDHGRSLDSDRKQLEADAFYQPWSTRAILLAEDSRMVGYFRFHTRPDAPYLRSYAPEGVEIGYCIFTGHRQCGYATEAVVAAMKWAGENYGIFRFVASVAPYNTASLKLIDRLGFEVVGQQVNKLDGVEHVYVLDVERREEGW